MGNVHLMKKTSFAVIRYTLLTVTDSVTISQIGKFVTDNAQGDTPFAERAGLLLSAFAEENSLGFLVSDNGFDFVLYEKLFFSTAEAEQYLQTNMAAA